MTSSRIFGHQAGRVVSAVVLLAATVASALIPAFASAEQITERSVQLSSSTKAAAGVQYLFTFTATNTAGATVVQFCDNTPLIGEFCDAPAGLNAATATAVGGGTIASAAANQVVITKAITAGINTFTLGTITNPTDAGPVYARILTYTDATAAAAYVVDDDSSALGSPKDQGSVAISITDGIGVSGAVLESMVFCVSGTAIDESCGGTLTAPVLKLGKDTAGVIALDPDDVYTGDVYTQLSTNALSGAVVSLKSDATGCGGLLRNGTGTAAERCGIGPALAAGIDPGDALFGVKTATATGVGDNANGTLQPYGTPSAYYGDSTFKMNWASGDLTGVTSTYGDPLLDTDGQPVNNMGMTLTFGASAANNTPAGNYAANLSLIATGTF